MWVLGQQFKINRGNPIYYERSIPFEIQEWQWQQSRTNKQVDQEIIDSSQA